ncbi:MAG: O-antigen ligase family protein [Bacteroidales bacterium]|nr:O-antigen ligase family protein [Bacteroidales bacterium]
MEILFAIFYLSGLLKSFFLYYGIPMPVDLTVLSVIMLIGGLIFQYSRNKIPLTYEKRNLNAFLVLILFFVWILISLIWTPSKSYSYEKAFLFVPNIIGFLIPLIAYRFNIARFFRIISLALPVISVLFITVYLKYSTDSANKEVYEAILGLYLVCSTLLGINVLVLAGSQTPIFKSSFVSTSVMIGSLLMMFILGARGPLIFTVILLIFSSIWKITKTSYTGKIILSDLKKIVYGATFVVMFMGLFLVFGDQLTFLVERSLVRLELLMPSSGGGGSTASSGMGTSVNVRVEQLNFGLELVTDNKFDSMFGYGLGSFGVMYSGHDGRAYPHNVFLEIWIEAGLLGLGIFLAFLWIIFTKNLNGTKYINMLVLIFILLNALKSSSFIDIRVYFAIFGMYIMAENGVKKLANGEFDSA